MAPQNAIVQRATAGIEELKAQLERGELISPVDNITADGSKLCGGEPLYHDLRCMPYTKYDVQEWIGKLRKFKAETVRYASQSRRLECGVKKLQQELAQSTEAFSVIESRIELVDGNTAHLSAGLQEETLKRNSCLAECNQMRRTHEQLSKQIQDTRKEILQTRDRITLLKMEVERNRGRHVAALGEKEQLNLERQWFFRERLLLEKTTEQEVVDIDLMKEKLDRLRHCMHQAWKDTKELDLLGHLRASKCSSFDQKWFSARRRLYH